MPAPKAKAGSKKPALCSYWLAGTCAKGKQCQFRHETPSAAAIADANAITAAAAKGKGKNKGKGKKKGKK